MSVTAAVALVLVLLAGVQCRRVCAVEDYQGAFIQTGDELLYFVGNQQLSESLSSNVNLKKHFAATDSAKPAIDSVPLLHDDQLNFEPSSLAFGLHSVATATRRKVKVHNPTSKQIRLDAISGSTVHFHCSFFDHKLVEPGSWTYFDVVFLPREEGVIETTLFIFSSIGVFNYRLSGQGGVNSYRLHPLVGSKIPLNSSFVGALELHNPYPNRLHITEVYSSDTDVHLELPAGYHEAPKAFWEVEPFQTKTILQTKVIGSKVKNATAFIRVRTDAPVRETVVIPVEVEVKAEPGLYLMNSMLDFGSLSRNQLSKWHTVSLFNTYSSAIRVEELHTDDIGLQVEFYPITVPSDNRKPSRVARLAYNPARSTHRPSNSSQVRTGKIDFYCRNKKICFSVSYRVQVLDGDLNYFEEELSFFSGSGSAAKQEVHLSSTFDQPITIYDVCVGKSLLNLFQVQDFMPPLVLSPRESRKVFTLHFSGLSEVDIGKTLSSKIRVVTNLTKFELPVNLFQGHLKFSLSSTKQDIVDFGAVNSSESRTVAFSIRNVNPVEITVKIENSLAWCSYVELVRSYQHCQKASRDPAGTSIPGAQVEVVKIPPNCTAYLKHMLVAPSVRSAYNGTLVFKSAYETVQFLVKFVVTDDSLIPVPRSLVIKDAFPGKVSLHALKVFSVSHEKVHLSKVFLIPDAAGFSFRALPKQNDTEIKQLRFTTLGRVYFNPTALCKLESCYVGLPLSTKDGHTWIRGLRLPPELPNLDYRLYNQLRTRWKKKLRRGEDRMNATLILETSTVKGLAVPVSSSLVWPRLLQQQVVQFPVTAVGNFTILNLTLQNPSNQLVAVQVIPLTIYPNPEELLKLLQKDLVSPLTGFVEMDDVLMFSLRDSELYNTKPESPVPAMRRELEKLAGIPVPRFTLSFVLKPRMKVAVRVGFLPSDYHMRSSLLLIRNNLTALEAVPIYGRGGRLELRMGSRLPQSNQPLLFEIQEKHLRECENTKRLQHKMTSSLTVKRSFVARNSGELTLTVLNISISGFLCQNRGFRVLNCESFTLKPNETHALEIAFTPDFSMSWYEAQLQLIVHGSHYPLLYMLGASVPTEWLPKCQAALPRPYWEPLMYYSGVTALGFLLVCVVASAYLEGDRTVLCALRQEMLASGTVFDLNDPKCGTNRRQEVAKGAADLAQVVSADMGNVNLSIVFTWLSSALTKCGSPFVDAISRLKSISQLTLLHISWSSSSPTLVDCQPLKSRHEPLAATRSGGSVRGKSQSRSDDTKKSSEDRAKKPAVREAVKRTKGKGNQQQKQQKNHYLSQEVRAGSHSDNTKMAIGAKAGKPAPEVDQKVKSQSAFKKIRKALKNHTAAAKTKAESLEEVDAASPSRARSTSNSSTAENTERKHLLESTYRSPSTESAVETDRSETDDLSQPEWNVPVQPTTFSSVDAEFDLLSEATDAFTKKFLVTSSDQKSAVSERRLAKTSVASATGQLLTGSSSGSVSDSVSSTGASCSSSPVPDTTRNQLSMMTNGAVAQLLPSSRRQRTDKTLLNNKAIEKKSNVFVSSNAASADPLRLHRKALSGRRTKTSVAVQPPQHQPSTLMQELHEERKQRLQEYSQRKTRGEDWPGVDLNPLEESLWDENFEPWKNVHTKSWNVPQRYEERPMSAIGEPVISNGSGMPLNFDSSLWHSRWSSPLQLCQEPRPPAIGVIADAWGGSHSSSNEVTNPLFEDSSILAWGPAETESTNSFSYTITDSGINRGDANERIGFSFDSGIWSPPVSNNPSDWWHNCFR